MSEATWRERVAWYCRRAWYPIRRKIPSVVWPGDEVWVLVNFPENRLQLAPAGVDDLDGSFGDAVRQLSNGALPEIEARFRELGIEFDKGLGMGGRDWEWDFSLKGPIKVTFKRKSKKAAP